MTNVRLVVIICKRAGSVAQLYTYWYRGSGPHAVFTPGPNGSVIYFSTTQMMELAAFPCVDGANHGSSGDHLRAL